MTMELHKKVCVVGAGTMGNGIAQVFASNGSEVSLVDLNPDALARGLATIEKNLARVVSKGRLSEDDASAALARIACADSGSNTWHSKAIARTSGIAFLAIARRAASRALRDTARCERMSDLSNQHDALSSTSSGMHATLPIVSRCACGLTTQSTPLVSLLATSVVRDRSQVGFQ